MRSVSKILIDKTFKEKVVNAIKKIKNKIGNSGASSRAAHIIEKL